jgi:hypothetical protein
VVAEEEAAVKVELVLLDLAVEVLEQDLVVLVELLELLTLVEVGVVLEIVDLVLLVVPVSSSLLTPRHKYLKNHNGISW